MEEKLTTTEFLTMTGDELVKHCAEISGKLGGVSARWEVDGLEVSKSVFYTKKEMLDYLKRAHHDDKVIMDDIEGIERLDEKYRVLESIMRLEKSSGQARNEKEIEQLGKYTKYLVNRLYNGDNGEIDGRSCPEAKGCKEEIDRHFLAEALDGGNRNAMLDKGRFENIPSVW